MNDINLPNDICKYVKKKTIRCIGLFLILEAVSITISVFSWEYFSTKTNLGFHISVLILLYIAPFFASGFPWELIDKSWSGIVSDVLVEEERAVNHTSAGRGHSYIKHIIYLKVRTDNGKERCVAVREFGIRHHKGFPVPNEGDVTKHLHEYSVGDQVYHFYGLKHYYIVKKNSEMVDCVVCGSQNKRDRKECLTCGHSLIKNI